MFFIILMLILMVYFLFKKQTKTEKIDRISNIDYEFKTIDPATLDNNPVTTPGDDE